MRSGEFQGHIAPSLSLAFSWPSKFYTALRPSSSDGFLWVQKGPSPPCAKTATWLILAVELFDTFDSIVEVFWQVDEDHFLGRCLGPAGVLILLENVQVIINAVGTRLCAICDLEAFAVIVAACTIFHDTHFLPPIIVEVEWGCGFGS